TEVFERNWRANQGAQVAPSRFVSVDGAEPGALESGTRKWRPKAIHLFYATRFLALAESYRIPVYWGITPATSDWRRRGELTGATKDYLRLIQRCVSRFPDLTILDGRSLDWEHRAFRDPIHLNRNGAVRLSLAVATAIGGGPAPRALS